MYIVIGGGLMVVPSLVHTSLQGQQRVGDPTSFRDFGLPTLETRRAEEILAPSSILGTIPRVDDAIPYRESESRLGRRVPRRTDDLISLSGGFPENNSY
jgi:hypothetical protein